MTLQAFYEIAEYKIRMKSRSLFWDADFDSIDWGRYKDAVIARVAERGNDAEKAEIAIFYGMPLSALDTVRPSNTYRINTTQRYDLRK